MRIIAAGMAIFAIYLPIALWLGRDFVPAPRPAGAVVIQLLKIEHVDGSFYRSDPFALSGRADVILYEGLSPIGPANFVKSDQRIYVTFSASDHSDPNTNGRKYWLVLP